MMKKFGTPIGAGPGSAYEKVGFDGVGTPPLVAGGGGAVGVDFFFGLGLAFDLGLGFAVDPGLFTLVPVFPELGLRDPGLCVLPDPLDVEGLWTVVVGVVLEEVGLDLVVVVVGVVREVDLVVEVEVEVVVEVELEVEVVCGCVLVVTVVPGVVAVPGGHDWATLMIGRLTGSGSEVGGVPGGTFWKVNC